MVKKLDKIVEGVCDGSASGAKSFREIVQTTTKHSTSQNQKDVWHKEVKIVKKWNNILKKKNAEELKKELPAEKLRCWFYICSSTCSGDVEVFHTNWLGAAQHWRNSKGLSDESCAILFHFLVSIVLDVSCYVQCISTALVESLHNLSNKYVPKRIHYDYKRYCAKKGLAVLDWNENMSRPRKMIRGKLKRLCRRTHEFCASINNKFIESCK